VGVDIDGDALEVARENAERNRTPQISWQGELPDGEFEVITANIQPEVLIPMAEQLIARLAVGGTLVLSGILVEAAPPVEAAHARLQLVERLDEEGWRALVLRR
jgi:ribosomal protein L11 methyltransferase